MPRAKRGFKARRRRNRILNHAEGFWGGRSRLFAVANEVVHKSWQYAYIGRKRKKRDFRRLWVARINAAARLIGNRKNTKIGIDRKILADLAIFDPAAFAAIAKMASDSAAKQPKAKTS